jgi:flagellar hook-associated protein 3 FlgL
MNGIDKYMEMLSSGKRVTRPSDDPVSAVRSMYHRTALVEIEQFKRNTTEAINWMELTDQTLGSVVNVVQRARELVVRASSDTMAESSRSATAEEIQQLKDQLGALANSSIGGRYIFAGTETKNEPPYDPVAGEFVSTNNAEIKVEMGKGIFLPINIPGTEIFTDSDIPGDDRESIFKVLEDAIEALTNPASTGKDIDEFISKIEQNFDLITSVRSALGAKINRIELIESRLMDSEYSTTKLLSDAEDADIPKVIINLKNQENVHQAALSAGARIIQRSLLDFLR